MTVIITRFLRNTQHSQTEICMQVHSHLQLVVLNQARVLSNTQQEHDLMHYKKDWHVNLVWDIYKESVQG